MSTVFAQTMKKTISIYRGMLRKYLRQDERMNKLRELNLKNPQLYENELALYHTGYAIIADIEKNFDKSSYGYYSYSGVKSFAEHLKTFLNNYEIEGNTIIHRSQKASRALIKAIQLLTLPKEKLTIETAEELAKCNEVIANFGSQEQRDLHKVTLQNTIRQQQEQHTSFYRSVLNNFQYELQKVVES